MKLILSLIIVLSITIGYSSAQCDCSTKNIKTQIDSIANSRSIKLGRVIHNKTTNDEGQDWTTKAEFKLEGEFLILNNTYYSLNKLLAFHIKEDWIDFIFQKI